MFFTTQLHWGITSGKNVHVNKLKCGLEVYRWVYLLYTWKCTSVNLKQPYKVYLKYTFINLKYSNLVQRSIKLVYFLVRYKYMVHSILAILILKHTLPIMRQQALGERIGCRAGLLEEYKPIVISATALIWETFTDRRAQRFLLLLGLKSGFFFNPVYQPDFSSDPWRCPPLPGVYVL